MGEALFIPIVILKRKKRPRLSCQLVEPTTKFNIGRPGPPEALFPTIAFEILERVMSTPYLERSPR